MTERDHTSRLPDSPRRAGDASASQHPADTQRPIDAIAARRLLGDIMRDQSLAAEERAVRLAALAAEVEAPVAQLGLRYHLPKLAADDRARLIAKFGPVAAGRWLNAVTTVSDEEFDAVLEKVEPLVLIRHIGKLTPAKRIVAVSRLPDADALTALQAHLAHLMPPEVAIVIGKLRDIDALPALQTLWLSRAERHPIVARLHGRAAVGALATLRGLSRDERMAIATRLEPNDAVAALLEVSSLRGPERAALVSRLDGPAARLALAHASRFHAGELAILRSKVATADLARELP